MQFPVSSITSTMKFHLLTLHLYMSPNSCMAATTSDDLVELKKNSEKDLISILISQTHIVTLCEMLRIRLNGFQSLKLMVVAFQGLVLLPREFLLLLLLLLKQE
uniref:Uncharacterized protein n=1 Tax=Opuntia streptacantha TaxID=393608 RepID=A0A7C9B4P0_OPUST